MKNVTAFNYSLADDELITREELYKFLPKLVHTDIKPHQKESFGFSSVVGYEENELVHSTGTWLMLSVTIEEKKVKKLRLERTYARRVKELEQKEKNDSAPVLSEDELKQIKDEVYAELLTDTEPVEHILNVIFDTQNNWIFVSDSAKSRIKKFVGLMQKHYLGFKLSEFCTHGIELHLTNWVYGDQKALPEEIDLEDSALLKSEQSSKASLSKQNLASDEITMLINHGKKCQEIAVTYLQRIGFRLTASCHMKSIRLTDQLLALVDEVDEPETRLEELIPFWEVMCAEITSVYLYLDKLQNRPI